MQFSLIYFLLLSAYLENNSAKFSSHERTSNNLKNEHSDLPVTVIFTYQRPLKEIIAFKMYIFRLLRNFIAQLKDYLHHFANII